jgi:hypothetical protein
MPAPANDTRSTAFIHTPGLSMASARQARAFMHEEDFLQALDGVADLVPRRRSLLVLAPEQQLQAWKGYADELEWRLDLAHEQLATLRMERSVHELVRRESTRDRSAEAAAPGHADQDRLHLLARVRAEQVMSVRLLNLLARCGRLEELQGAEREAAAVLDATRRRELRAIDFEDSLAEHHALWQAQRDEQMRRQDSGRARPLAVPAYWAHEMHGAADAIGRGGARPVPTHAE